MSHHPPPPRVLGFGLAVALAASSIASTVASASEWQGFRGPNGQGWQDGNALPLHFGPESAVIWKTALPPGHSSPVIGEHRIFVTAAEGDRLLTIALDRATGAEVWRREAPRPRRQALDNRNGPASPSPVTDGRSVFVFFGDFGLLAYDESGNESWRLALGPFDNIYGIGASPILAGDLVVLVVDQQTGSYLLAADRKTGALRWRVDRPEAKSGHSTPVLYQPAGGEPQIVVPGSFLLTAYSLSGAKLWWVRGLSFEMKSTPAIADGSLYINGYGSQFNDPGQQVETPDFATALETGDTNGDGRLAATELVDELAREWLSFTDLDADGTLDDREWSYFRAALESRNNVMAVRLPRAAERGDLTDTHVRWRYYEKVPQLPSPIVYRNVLTMINDRGIATTFDPDSGRVLHQGRIDGVVDSFYASPVAGDGKLFLIGRSGKVAVLAATGGLEPLAVNDLDAQVVATPAIADGRLYIRTDGALFAFGTAPPRVP